MPPNASNSCGRILSVTKTFQPDPTDGSCGVACAATVLGAKAPAWAQLWSDVKQHSPGTGGKGGWSACGQFPTQVCECGTCWCSHPAALLHTLNQYQPQRTYYLEECATDAAATDLVRISIDQNIPAVVAIKPNQHWVVVYGYECDPVHPATITHVWVHDPNINRMQGQVTRSTWHALYLVGNPCGSFQGSRLVLGAAARAKKMGGGSGVTPESSTGGPPVVVSPDVIREGVPSLVDGLLKQEAWVPAYRAAQAGDPVLVHGPDDSAYYLVPFRHPDGRSVGRALFDASGELAEIGGIEEAGDALPPFFTKSDIPRLLDGRQVTGRLGAFVIEPFKLEIGDTLVWRPCDQSASRYQPFYELHQGRERFYLRVDGALFPELTQNTYG